MVVSPRAPLGMSGLPGDNSMASFMAQYVNNWAVVQQALASANVNADLLAAIQNQGFGVAPDGGDTTIIKEAPRGGGDRVRMPGGGGMGGGFTGGGYARNPGEINSNIGGWGSVLNALGGSGGMNPDRAARKAMRNMGDTGTYVDPGKERTRERSRTHTSKDGTTTTTTNVNISRNGGTAIANDSGSDGNQKKRKKKSSEMIY